MYLNQKFPPLNDSFLATANAMTAIISVSMSTHHIYSFHLMNPGVYKAFCNMNCVV